MKNIAWIARCPKGTWWRAYQLENGKPGRKLGAVSVSTNGHWLLVTRFWPEGCHRSFARSEWAAAARWAVGA